MPVTTARQTEVVTEAPLVRVANVDLRKDDVIVLISGSGWCVRQIASHPLDVIDGGEPVVQFGVRDRAGKYLGQWVRPINGFSFVEASNA